MSAEEIEKEKEKQLFCLTRAILKDIEVSRALSVAEKIVRLEPSEERLRKSEGVMLEMLVYYDYTDSKPKDVLKAALMIAEYIMKNLTDEVQKNYALLNYLQIKKRLGTLSFEEHHRLYSLAKDSNSPNEIAVGAAILCEDYEKAADSFSRLSDEEKTIFIQFPIYRLWPNPPMEPNADPALFNVF